MPSFVLESRRRLPHHHGGGDLNRDIDHLAPRVVLLALAVVVGSALDALFTLLHLQLGASEANPVMAMALDQGINAFVGLKMALTGLGVILLAIHQNLRLGLKSLQGLALIYGSLLAYHLLLFMTAS